MLQCLILELEMVFSWLNLLAKFGFSNITGIDYSPSAIQLSGSIIKKEGLSNIKLKVEDFLNLSTEFSGFQICIDKGTFDAISLNPDNAIEKRKQYVKSLSKVLKVKGFFLITSCNWTTEELLNEFNEGFELVEELPTPKFSFGGRSGNSVAALVFQKTLLYPDLFNPLSCKRDICCVFSTCQLGNQGLCSGLRLTTHTLWCTMPPQLACFRTSMVLDIRLQSCAASHALISIVIFLQTAFNSYFV
ncbi:EEF1A lysine methyltransferase 2 isoform X4 [Tupaia chinensis]|uniref:EEF1A lysine methyltransferase 2 isoform X4 n=1 Tax=Tupaia chinensis TaxID=246437 RepID=UPI000FFC7135|nr:EEF1A lysine methyltransferase 2 isoform X4 [Tupaia chinensis]